MSESKSNPVASAQTAVNNQVNDVLAQVNKFLDQYEFLNNLQNKAGIPKLYIVLGALVPVLLLLLRTVGFGFIVNLYGFLYPTYASFKAIRSADKNDDTQWLTYWCVFSTFALCESFMEAAKRGEEHGKFFWMVYYLIKIAVITWAMFPHTRGAQLVWEKVLQPIFVQIEGFTNKSGASAAPASTTPASTASR